MPLLDPVEFRTALPSDAADVAALHADSWRRHYRGAYSDAYLDGDLMADRLAVWAPRLSEPGSSRQTIVAHDDHGLIGFAHVVFDDDPGWGALLDNLHVTYAKKRGGVGSRLLALSADAVLDRPVATGLYLWVLEQNTDAQAFYRARGGECVGRAACRPPGGVPGRLHGSPAKLRFAWPDPSALSSPRPTG